MLTVLIYYEGSPNFNVIITQLQSQLSTEDDIYIVDSTSDHSGVEIVQLYGTTRCYIFVEVGKYTRDQAKQFGIQSAKENKQDGVLFFDENAFISATFISNLKKAISLNPYGIISPVVKEVPVMDTNFNWFNPPTKGLAGVSIFSPSCYYLPFSDLGTPTPWLFKNETVLILQPPT